MQSAKAVMLLLLTVTLPAYADKASDRKACEKVKQQIRELEAKMRNGYSAAQGIRYDERMRELKDKRYRLCR